MIFPYHFWVENFKMIVYNIFIVFFIPLFPSVFLWCIIVSLFVYLGQDSRHSQDTDRVLMFYIKEASDNHDQSPLWCRFGLDIFSLVVYGDYLTKRLILSVILSLMIYGILPRKKTL